MSNRRSSSTGGGGTRAVFVSLRCQHDNLGDLVIRREMVRWFDTELTTIHALVGDTPAEFLDAALPSSATRYPSGRAWTRAMLSAGVRGHAVVVFAPGPQTLTRGLGTYVRGVLSLLYTAALPRLGSPVVKLGRSLRGSDPIGTAIERLGARVATQYVVRDRISAEILRGHCTVAPDLALSAAPPVDDADRTLVALSPRVGRSWPIDEVRTLVDGVRAAGLSPVLVTQVRRDEQTHSDIAAVTGIEHLDWAGRSSTDQLARVEDVYRRSLVVVSDRLHALLLGIVGGAVAVPWRDDDDKIAPTLAAAGIESPVGVARTDVDALLAWAHRHSSDVREQHRVAAATLADTRVAVLRRSHVA